MTDYQPILNELLRKGELTQVDLATWLESDRNSIIQWLAGKTSPRPYRCERLDNRIKLLRRAMEDGHLPLPPSVKSYNRKAEIKRIRDEYLKNEGVFATNTPK